MSLLYRDPILKFSEFHSVNETENGSDRRFSGRLKNTEERWYKPRVYSTEVQVGFIFVTPPPQV